MRGSLVRPSARRGEDRRRRRAGGGRMFRLFVWACGGSGCACGESNRRTSKAPEAWPRGRLRRRNQAPAVYWDRDPPVSELEALRYVATVPRRSIGFGTDDCCRSLNGNAPARRSDAILSENHRHSACQLPQHLLTCFSLTPLFISLTRLVISTSHCCPRFTAGDVLDIGKILKYMAYIPNMFSHRVGTEG